MKSTFRYARALLQRFRHTAAEANRISYEQESLRLLAENCGDVIFRFGVDGRVPYISPSVERLFGCPLKDIYAMGGDVVQNGFVYEEDQAAVALAVEGHFAGTVPQTKLEFRIRQRGGAIIWVETNCSTVLDRKSGRPTDIVFTMRDISEKKALEARLEAFARKDGLTGIANRRAFDEELEREWRAALGENGALSLLIIDVDCFKAFNDANGHQVGDDCLRTVAAAIDAHAEQHGALAARYGGEEFALVLPRTDYERALAAGERIRCVVEALGVPHSDAAVSSVVTVSVGVATAMAANGGTIAMPHGLLQAADAALYKAKAGGRNRVEGALLFSPKEAIPAAA
jgi:diguanylate cyclase (GGDEF)-like protein/PAS domain S-box-containing protein